MSLKMSKETEYDLGYVNQSRNTDQLEQASNLQEALNEKGLAEVREALRSVPPPADFDGLHCVDCGNEVHPQRLEAGRFRCTSCQTIIEQRSKIFR